MRFSSETGPKPPEKGPEYPEISSGKSPAGRRSDHGATRPEIPRKKSSPNSYDAKIRRSDRPVNFRIGITPRGVACRANARVNTTTPTTPPPAPATGARPRADPPLGRPPRRRPCGRLRPPPRRAFRLRRRAGAHGQSDDPAALAADGRVAPAGGGRVDRERTPGAESVLRAQLRVSGTAVWRYHAVNVLTHPASARLLFGRVRRTLRRPGWGAQFGDAAVGLALTIAAVWSLTPPANPGRDLHRATRGVAPGLFLSAHAPSLRAGHRGRCRGGLPAAVARPRGRRVCPRHGDEGGHGHRAAARLPLRPHVCRRLVARAWRERRGCYAALGVNWGLLAALMLSTGGTVGLGVGGPLWAYPLKPF